MMNLSREMSTALGRAILAALSTGEGLNVRLN